MTLGQEVFGGSVRLVDVVSPDAVSGSMILFQMVEALSLFVDVFDVLVRQADHFVTPK